MPGIERVPLIVLALLATPVAFAQVAESGFYLGGGIGSSQYSIDYGTQVRNAYAPTFFTVPSAGMTDTRDTAYKVLGGYQFMRYLAVEVAWNDLGKATASYTVNDASERSNPRNATYDLSGFNASLVGLLPVGERFTLLGKVGAFFSKLEYSETGTNSTGDAHSFTAPNDDQTRFSWGLGAAWRFTDHLSLRVDWDRFQNIGQTFALTTTGNGEFSHVDFVSANLIWRF